MAKKSIIIVSDDLDPSQTEGVETVQFSFGGFRYTVDLGEENRARFEEAMRPYIAAGDRIGRDTPAFSGAGRPAVAAAPPRRRDSREVSREIRAWAEKHGIYVSDRGRIKQDVVDQFNAAKRAAPRQVVMPDAAATEEVAAEGIQEETQED